MYVRPRSKASGVSRPWREKALPLAALSLCGDGSRRTSHRRRSDKSFSPPWRAFRTRRPGSSSVPGDRPDDSTASSSGTSHLIRRQRRLRRGDLRRNRAQAPEGACVSTAPRGIRRARCSVGGLATRRVLRSGREDAGGDAVCHGSVVSPADEKPAESPVRGFVIERREAA